MVHLGNDWDGILAGEFQQEYYKKIRYWLKKEYAEQTIYPPMEDIFNALRYTAYQDVKAVILGQDPYHGPGQAHGLCFSVRPGVPQPPSLQNIFKELQSDLGIAPPRDGTLTRWAERGVLLLNTTLTVRRGQANSHKKPRLDDLHRPCNRKAQPARAAGGVPALGRQRAQQKGPDHRAAASGARVRAPLAALSELRLFRLPAFFQMQRLSGAARRRADRLGPEPRINAAGGCPCGQPPAQLVEKFSAPQARIQTESSGGTAAFIKSGGTR